MKTLGLICIVFLLAGCTSIRYGDFHYESIGGKKFDKLSAMRDANGDIIVELSNYEKEGISAVAEGMARGFAEGIK